jgi:indole-3-glycerol phosphate synthase
MESILEKIVARRMQRLEQERAAVSPAELESRACRVGSPMDFADALRGPGTRIIAEVKKASPSKGVLREEMNPGALAKSYETGGAAAVSVITEEDHFLGSIAALADVRRSISLPVLRKDFILDRYQVVEARAYGADSFLLIAGVMDRDALAHLIGEGRTWGMEPLVEVHDESELEKALDADAQIIGINNRDLKTFRVDLTVTEGLMQRIPRDRVVVSESGIASRDDIRRLEAAGVSGFLVGETLVRSHDPAAKLRELIDDARR